MNRFMRLLGGLILFVASVNVHAGCYTDENGILRCVPDTSGSCIVRSDGALVCP